MLDKDRIPSHVAIIMDGNGRWAKKHHLNVSRGHRQGTENLREIIRHTDDLGIKVLSLYAFSTENCNRSEEEVGALMQLILEFFASEIDEQTISDHLYTAGQPDVDLMIRTSGEQRLSNFLLYQNAYAEFIFPETLWPDFSVHDYDLALDAYARRDRRFGGR